MKDLKHVSTFQKNTTPEITLSLKKIYQKELPNFKQF